MVKSPTVISTDDALPLLRSCGAFLDGHFLLSSGLHSGVYVEKFRLLERPDLTQRFAAAIAHHFRDTRIELVVGPLTGGVLVAHEVGKQLGLPIAFPERVEEFMEWRRGFSLRRGQQVLVCEDVITTGRSVGEVAEAVRREGAEVAGIGALIQRGQSDLNPTPFAVVPLELETYTPENCPLCRQGLPLEKRGSRKVLIPS